MKDKFTVLKNKKIILGVLALLMCLICICLFSFIPYTISKDRIQSKEFLTDVLILCAIVILAMTSSIFIGQASNAQNPQSKVAKAIVKFIESKTSVIARGIHTFKQWIKQVQQPADVKAIKVRILTDAGVDDLTILDLNIPEIETLLNTPQIINNIPYPALTEEQLKIILRVKTKGIKVTLVPPEYYLSVKNLTDKRTPSERATAEGIKKALTLLVSVGSKLVMTIVFSIIWALFVKDVSQDPSKAEAYAKLFSRLSSFFTSVFMGYLVGCQINDIDAEYVNMRHEIHLEFLEDKEFSPLDIKAQAKQDVIQRLKNEQVLELENK